MASVSTLPGSQNEHRGLSHWMDRVFKELEKLRASPDKDAVHDLRVAIRRCRSVGAVMREVDPDPSWHELRGVPKKLFRKLGELRDAQIMDEWVSEHGAENDKLRLQLHASFQAREQELTEDALRIAGKFDEKAWTRLSHKLSKRVRLAPPGSLAAQCLAVERYDEAKQLHAKALRAKTPEAWHALRIGLKKFRYTTESLLPQHYEKWSPMLKKLQDLLGEVHDLDVLSGIIKQEVTGEAAAAVPEWERTIERERKARLDEYREASVGKKTFWQEWRRALPQNEKLRSAAMARLRVMARASDAHPRRAAHLSRLAIALFDALGRAQTAPAFDSPDLRRVLRGASRLSGIKVKGTGTPQKAARHFLMSRPVPPSWTPAEWELLAWCVRYHRGAEPRTENSAFSRLSEESQMNIRALAGLIRLARGLRKVGIVNCAGIRAEKAAAAVTIHIPDLPDSAETAALLAAAKHLLDSYLGKPVILKPTPKIQVLELPAPVEPPVNITSVASD
jgi:CHAD domain-containing protein